MRSLTERQVQCLDFIRAYTATHGYPPSLRDIGASMGIRSTNGVNDHLRALERKGAIRRSDMKSRSTVVLGSGDPLAEEAAGDAVVRHQAKLDEENRALRLLLRRVVQASGRLPRLTAEMTVLVGDIRNAAVEPGSP